MLVDVHQHVWTRALAQALAERTACPLVRVQHGLTVLYSDGEPPFVVDLDAEDPERRASLIREDSLDLALVAISSPIGIEALPREEALGLIDAHLRGVLSLPDSFGAWGPIATDRPVADDVDELLARGCVGISVAAGALADSNRLEKLGPVLERAADVEVPVLVHPGRAAGQRATAYELGEPLWWRPMTDYVSQMQAAWLIFASLGRREHQRLRVVFSMLAGAAPFLTERLSGRGGPAIDLHDELTFYETSSYGPQTVELMATLVGEEQLLYGSDRPVIEPAATGRDLALKRNGGELIAKVAV